MSVRLLQVSARSKNVLVQLISRWALGVHYWREEERDEARRHFGVCRALAPHCLVLHSPPGCRSSAG